MFYLLQKKKKQKTKKWIFKETNSKRIWGYTSALSPGSYVESGIPSLRNFSLVQRLAEFLG